MGNRTAIPLLLSTVAAYMLDSEPFHWQLCVLLDCAVIVCVSRRNMPLADKIILALLIPAWVSYALPDPWKYWGSSAVVILQLLLTIPLSKHQKIGGMVSHGPVRGAIYGEGA
jgi:hypothetical protein